MANGFFVTGFRPAAQGCELGVFVFIRGSNSQHIESSRVSTFTNVGALMKTALLSLVLASIAGLMYCSDAPPCVESLPYLP